MGNKSSPQRHKGGHTGKKREVRRTEEEEKASSPQSHRGARRRSERTQRAHKGHSARIRASDLSSGLSGGSVQFILLLSWQSLLDNNQLCAYNCTYEFMFEWDPHKARTNQSKHGVAFADTFAVFEDPYAVTISQWEEDEERFVTIGTDAFFRILVVVYTWRGERIRIISARRAAPSERRHYAREL
jgi:uncharacterized protein